MAWQTVAWNYGNTCVDAHTKLGNMQSNLALVRDELDNACQALNISDWLLSVAGDTPISNGWRVELRDQNTGVLQAAVGNTISPGTWLWKSSKNNVIADAGLVSWNLNVMGLATSGATTPTARHIPLIFTPPPDHIYMSLYVRGRWLNDYYASPAVDIQLCGLNVITHKATL